jgi:hypothetical protein
MVTSSIVQQVLDWLKTTGTFVAQNGWRIAMRQVYFYGAMDITLGIILLVSGTMLFLRGEKQTKQTGGDWFDVDGSITARFGWGFIGTILLIAAVITLLCSIRFFFNPEWYAIQLIISQVK